MKGPCHFVVFGALGHLVTTKLLPSLYHLELAGRLGEPLAFIAFARRDWDTQRWRAHLNDALAEHYVTYLDETAACRFVERFEYVKGDYTDPAAYRRLFEQINLLELGRVILSKESDITS